MICTRQDEQSTNKYPANVRGRAEQHLVILSEGSRGEVPVRIEQRYQLLIPWVIEGGRRCQSSIGGHEGSRRKPLDKSWVTGHDVLDAVKQVQHCSIPRFRCNLRQPAAQQYIQFLRVKQSKKIYEQKADHSRIAFKMRHLGSTWFVMSC